MAPAAEQVRTVLRRSWQCSPGDCTALTRSAWRVEIGAERFLAKRVAAERRAQFEAGLQAAIRVEASGIGAGAPVRAADGALAVTDDDGVLALIRWVPGRPLDAEDPLDQQWWGNTLAAVHRALDRFAHPGLVSMLQLRPEAAHLGLQPWLRQAVSDAVAAVKKLCVTDQLTYGVLHGAPTADEFRLDPDTGRVGLVKWAAAGTGPLVYDLAYAVLSAGGPDSAEELLDGYLSACTVSRDECEAALPTMLRFCAAVRADRCAARIHADGAGSARDRVELAEVAAWLGR